MMLVVASFFYDDFMEQMKSSMTGNGKEDA